jgi:serine/threonine protein kinase
MIKEIGDYQFDLVKELGKGSFATVYEGKEIKTGKKIAVRVITRKNMQPSMESRIQNEGDIMKKLQHPNLLKCYDFISSKNNYYFITDLCEMDLEEYLKKQPMK